MRNIRKQYPGVLALDNVSFELQAGEVHCLLGENGAGKSTLMKVLSGAIQRDSGDISIDDKPVVIQSPIQSQKHGIGMIYQDFKLVPELSIAENILLGHEPTKGKSSFIDFSALHKKAESILNQLGEQFDTHLPLYTLSVAQKQVVEIAKALSRNVRILAMDEPSASLTQRELKTLFAIIKRLKSDGVGIIYISHRLEEIFEIGDRLTVLRDGKHITTCALAEANRRRLINWMVGREIEQEYPKVELKRGEEILRVENVCAGVVKNASFSLYKGEIFGFGGLVGAGRSDLAKIIFGADKKESGKIFLRGKEIAPLSPRDAIDLGIGLLTEDRNHYGLFMQLGIKENISISNLAELMKGPFIDAKREAKAVNEYSNSLRIKTPSIEQLVENLSGGNRQKVVLARWLFTKSKVLIFDEPTVGIDVGVKYEIYTLLNKLAEEGYGVIVISSDLPELLGICDRIAVMWQGNIRGILHRSEFSQERVMTLATGELTGEEHD